MKIHKVKQGTLPWFVLRIGKVTGSRFKQLMSSDNLSLVDTLIAEQITLQSQESDYVSEDMQRGIDLEPLAAKEYERMFKKKTKQVGFVTSDEFPMFGISPDRLIGRKGALEIKCPGSKVHVKTIRQNKIPNEYKYQVLAYFLVHEKLDWLDFMSYDPRFYKRPVFVVRVTRTELTDEIMEAIENMKGFFLKFEIIKQSIIF